MADINYVDSQFKFTNPIRYFKANEFNKIPEMGIMNIVLDIRQHKLDILASWEKYFKVISVPYAVQKLIVGSMTGNILSGVFGRRGWFSKYQLLSDFHLDLY